MKKQLFYLCMCAFFISSCSDENSTLLDSDVSPTLRTAGDGKYDVLGQGCDITEEYLHPKSVKAAVIDINKYIKDFPNRVIPETPGWGGDQMYYGYSAIDYTYDVTKETNAFLKIENAEKAFCGTFTNNSYFKSSYSYSSKYSFASVDAVRNNKRIYINDEVTRYSKYLTAEFIEDLNRLPASRLIERYGTHVLSDITIGGRYRIMFSSVINNTKNSTTKRSTVQAGLGFVLDKIGFTLNAEHKTEINESLAKENQEKQLSVFFYGGTGTSLDYDLEKGYPSKIDLGKWENTVNVNNATLTDINWKETHPIYDFITDPTKKAQVKAAVENYIKSKQLKILEIESVYRYFSGDWKDHLYTIDPLEQNGTSGTSKYEFEKIGFYLLKKQEPGSVPVYRYFSSDWKDHLYTIDPSEQNGTSGTRKYKFEGIAGYAYKTQQEGTVPVYRYFSSDWKDHLYTIDPSEQNGTSGGRKYGFEKIGFYVYPDK